MRCIAIFNIRVFTSLSMMLDDLLAERAENEVDICAYFEVLRIQADHVRATQGYAQQNPMNPSSHVHRCLVVICSNRYHIPWLTFERDLCDGPSQTSRSVQTLVLSVPRCD